MHASKSQRAREDGEMGLINTVSAGKLIVRAFCLFFSE